MNESNRYDYNFGTAWETFHVERREAYSTSVTDYHKHDFYEINLIQSGNVKILLKDRFESGKENRIVLTAPQTPHYITCDPDTLYRRIYLVFTDRFVANLLPEWDVLRAVFGESGNTITLSEDEADNLEHLIEQTEREDSALGQRLLIYYILLQISKLAKKDEPAARQAPSYIFDALSYIEENFSQDISFEELAKSLYIGRTTLMTGFKLHTGVPIGEYLCKCRLRNAVKLLASGQTLETVSESCGFSDSSSLIKAFKRVYGTTPHKYILSHK
jgi:AraC-like DNA-binding protein